MAQQTINIGSSASDGTGDELRVAFDKVNDNFTELYATAENSGLTYSNVSTITSGSGTGARFTVNRYANTYTVDIINNAGTDYAVADTLTIFGNALGGTSGVNDVTLTVLTLGNATIGNIATISNVGVPANPVLSVNGQTGDVTLDVNDIANAASKGYVTNAINGNVATLSSNLTSINANVTAANAVISTHTSQIQTLDANVGTLWGNVGGLAATKATISYVDTSIDNALSSNAVLANVTSINANVAAANVNIANNTANLVIFRANLGTQDLLLDALDANVGTIVGNTSTTFYTLVSNAATQSVAITNNTNQINNLFSNAGAQADSINTLIANAVTQHNSITTLDANLGTATDNITALQGNTATTVNEVNLLRANITAANATIASNDADIQAINANLGLRSTEIISLDANLGTATTNITSLTSNAATQATSINTLTANAATQAISIDTLTANAAAQADSLATLTANAATQSVAIVDLQNNAGVQGDSIVAIDANLGTVVGTTIPAIDANLGAYQTSINANLGTVVGTTIPTLDANVGYIRTNYANTATSATFTGNVNAPYFLASANVKVDGGLEVGTAPTVDFPGRGAYFGGNVDADYQVIVQNKSTGTSASSDFVLAADNATATTKLVRLSMNSSNFTGNFIGSQGDTGLVKFPGDGYIEVIGGNAAISSDGNVFITANTAVVSLLKDGDLVLSTGNLQFRDGTIQSSAFTGGVWSDVDANIGGISDGVTVNSDAIFEIRANTGAYQTYANLSLDSVNANVAAANVILFQVDLTAITAINANVAAANLAIDGTQANIGSYQTYANSEIQTLDANLGTVVGTTIPSIDANIGAYQAYANTSITTINNNVSAANLAIADNTSDITTVNANVAAANSAIGTNSTNITTLDANLGTATTNINTLTANAGAQATSINTLDANLGTATTAITSLVSNAGVQATSINTLDANLGTATTNITTLLSNAGSQATSINTLDANLGTATTNITTLDANLGTATTNISTLDANLGTATTNISTLDANVGAYQGWANAAFAFTSTVDALDANVGSQQTYANTQFATVASFDTLDANVGTVVGTTFPTLNANIGAFQLFANSAYGAGAYTDANVAAYTGNMNNMNTLTAVTVNATTGNITNLTTTLTTGAQPNITSVGQLTSLNVSGNAIINGNLTVANLNSIASHTINVQDPLLELSANTIYPYNYDIGVFSEFTGGSSNVAQHTGVVRDYTDNVWKVFSNVTAEPGATIDWSDPDIVWDRLRVGNLTIANSTASTSTTTGALILAGGAGIAGNVNAPHVVATTSMQSPIFNGAAHTGQSGTFSANVGANHVNVTNTVQAATVNATTAVTSAAGTFSANVAASHLNITNSVQAATVNGTTVNAGTLQIGATSVSATAAELNLIDGSVADTVVNNKAVIYSGAGNVRASALNVTNSVQAATVNATTHTGGSGVFSANVGANHVNVTNTVQAATVNATTAVTAQAATITANASASHVNVTNTVQAATVNATTAVTSAAGTFSANVGANHVNATTTVQAPTINAATSLTAQAATITANLAVSHVNVTNSVQAATVNGTTAVTGAAGTFSANVGASHVNVTNSVQATTGNFSGNVTASYFVGTATEAIYADLAENYQADTTYDPGTVLVFGGEQEVTVTSVSHDERVAGIVSTQPAYLMNTGSGSVAVGLTGRLPCMVQGPVNKGTLLVTSATPGVAQALDKAQWTPGCVIGKSLEAIEGDSVALIEVAVGRD